MLSHASPTDFTISDSNANGPAALTLLIVLDVIIPLHFSSYFSVWENYFTCVKPVSFSQKICFDTCWKGINLFIFLVAVHLFLFMLTTIWENHFTCVKPDNF